MNTEIATAYVNDQVLGEVTNMTFLTDEQIREAGPEASHAQYAFPTGWERIAPKEPEHMIRVRSAPRLEEAGCGHRIDLGVFPSTKCEGCWGFFFATNTEMTVQNLRVLREGRSAELTEVHGAKYTKMLGRFMVFIEKVKALKDMVESNHAD